MPTRCRLVDTSIPDWAAEEPKPGDMWPMNLPDDELSPEYHRDWKGKRPPYFICLPDGNWWCPDRKESSGDSGWTVTGEPPNLTARPSVNSGTYHGWLTNGVLSDGV